MRFICAVWSSMTEKKERKSNRGKKENTKKGKKKKKLCWPEEGPGL